MIYNYKQFSLMYENKYFFTKYKIKNHLKLDLRSVHNIYTQWRGGAEAVYFVVW